MLAIQICQREAIKRCFQVKRWRLNKERKPYADVAKVHGENECSARETVKKEKEIRGSFAVIPQTAKVTTQCLVRMQKALNLYNKILCVCERGHIHIFITVYCYNCCILSLVVINLLLCLIYKLNFITDIYSTYRKKHSIYRVQYYL